MQNVEFYIGFRGSAERFARLERFVSALGSTKTRLLEHDPPVDEFDSVVMDSSWIDLLDQETIERLTRPDSWGLEDILECLLRGEYDLVKVTFDGESGRLIYDPWAYPFGGTEALKALVETMGLQVTRDSFHDGFQEWQRQNAP